MKRVVMCVVLILTGVAVALAQLPTGTILGTVKDSKGAVVAGATVSVRNTGTDESRTADTGTDGTYRFEGLPVGKYQVRAEQTGFKATLHTGVTLAVGQEAVIDVTLEVGIPPEIVYVTGEAPTASKPAQAPPAPITSKSAQAPPAPTQPLPFSHKTHSAQSLQCQTCHVVSAATSSMSYPETATCMNCHASIDKDKPSIQKLAAFDKSKTAVPWVAVYKVLPGVAWSHSEHLAAGTKCEACHGQVDQMDAMAAVKSVTSMDGCIGCHKINKTPADTCFTCHPAWEDNQ